MNIGARIRFLIDMENITQRQLAASIHISPSALNGYINKGTEPDYDTLIRLADFFHTSTDYLLGTTNVRTPHSSSLSYSEEKLLGTYRRLTPYNQRLVCEEAKIIYNLSRQDE